MDLRDYQFLDHVDHPVFVIAPDDAGVPRYVAYNASACRILNRRREDFLGRTAKECFSGTFGAVTYSHHLEVLASGAERTYEVALDGPDDLGVVRTVLKPVKDDTGRVTHLVGSSTAVSKRQVLGHQATAGLQDADSETFVALAAHELRSPLRNIGLIFEMLREEVATPTEDAELLFEQFERAHSALFEHIDDILAHTNTLEAQKENLEFEFEALVHDIMQVQDPLGLCEISVTPARLMGDRSGIQIVIGNLIDNAIKHAQPSGGTLRLAATVRQDGRGYLSVTLSDNGLGFSEPALVLLDGGALRPGSGFGLFGVRRLIHSRGGRLLITRASDQSGASITFALRGRILDEQVTGQPNTSCLTFRAR